MPVVPLVLMVESVTSVAAVVPVEVEVEVDSAMVVADVVGASAVDELSALSLTEPALVLALSVAEEVPGVSVELVGVGPAPVDVPPAVPSPVAPELSPQAARATTTGMNSRTVGLGGGVFSRVEFPAWPSRG